MTHTLRTFLALLAMAFLACGGGGEPAPMRIGASVPEFQLAALDGTQVASQAFLGREIVVVFWATWCQPCIREIPLWKELATETSVEIVAIALDEEGALAVRPFVERNDIPYTVLLGDQEMFQRWGGLTIPYTLVLDGSQRVVNYYRGPVTRQALEEDLATLRGPVDPDHAA